MRGSPSSRVKAGTKKKKRKRKKEREKRYLTKYLTNWSSLAPDFSETTLFTYSTGLVVKVLGNDDHKNGSENECIEPMMDLRRKLPTV